MTISDLFEDFGSRSTAEMPAFISTEKLEEQKLEAFENGYRAGWDDATEAQTRNNARISAALAERLQDIAFTRQEALAQILDLVEHLLRRVLAVVLPEIMFRSFGQHIVDELVQASRNALDSPVEIVVPEGMAQALGPLLPTTGAMQVNLVESAEIGPHQARLRIGRSETELDAERLLQEIRETVDAFMSQAREEFANG